MADSSPEVQRHEPTQEGAALGAPTPHSSGAVPDLEHGDYGTSRLGWRGGLGRAQRYLKRIPQYTRHARHFRSVVQHGTPRKWANLVWAEVERKRRRVTLTSHPYLLIIDPCNYCNLRCPLCPTGMNDLGRPQAMLSFEHFGRYFDPFVPFIFEVYLHNWGESLLNPDIYRMIAYAQARNVGTNLSSNFSDLTSSDLDNILDSGLEYLIVSLDGTSQDTYGTYRIRGRYEQVLANLAELLRRRRARRMTTPAVEWQFIVMRQNEHQLDEAQVLARKLGVDLLRFIPVGMPFETRDRQRIAERWYPVTLTGRNVSNFREQQFGQAEKPGPCFYLYRSMVVNPDGGVSPCCVVYRKNRDFADLHTRDIDVMSIWNNAKYRSARALFSTNTDHERVPTVCDGCDLFARPGLR